MATITPFEDDEELLPDDEKVSNDEPLEEEETVL